MPYAASRVFDPVKITQQQDIGDDPALLFIETELPECVDTASRFILPLRIPHGYRTFQMIVPRLPLFLRIHRLLPYGALSVPVNVPICDIQHHLIVPLQRLLFKEKGGTVQYFSLYLRGIRREPFPSVLPPGGDRR